MEMDSRQKNHVKSILKAFQIIEELDRCGTLSIGEISQALSMDKGTVHRLVTTIKEAGYIVQNPYTRKYANGVKLFTIGNRVIERTEVKKVARPYLEALAEETKETINLCMHSGTDIIYIDKIDSDSPIKVGIKIGTDLPMYCTGMGKSILAFLPEERLRWIVDHTVFQKRTAKTVPSQEALLMQLVQVREQGYAKDEEEYVEGLISFAAPILDYKNHPVAAISISMPKLRYYEDAHKEYYIKLVKNAVVAISNALGYK